LCNVVLAFVHFSLMKNEPKNQENPKLPTFIPTLTPAGFSCLRSLNFLFSNAYKNLNMLLLPN